MTRMTAVLNASVVALCGATLLGAALGTHLEAESGVDRRAEQSLLAVQVASALVELYASQHGLPPGPTDGLVPIDSFRSILGRINPRYFAERDAWGNRILYWSNRYGYVLMSLGSDGAPDREYDFDGAYLQGVPAGVNTRSEQDIILVNGLAYRGPFGQRGGVRATLADMRSVGTACEAYSIDNNFYPAPAIGGLVPVSDLKSLLEPIYIRALPIQDGWANPLLYWSDRTFYAIISTGADGIPDNPYDRWRIEDFRAFHGGQTYDTRRDIVFEQGQFVQYPAGTYP